MLGPFRQAHFKPKQLDHWAQSCPEAPTWDWSTLQTGTFLISWSSCWWSNHASLQVPIALYKAHFLHVSHKVGALRNSRGKCCKPQGFLLSTWHSLKVASAASFSILVVSSIDSSKTEFSTVQVLIIIVFICINFDYLFLYQNFTSINDVRQKITSLLSSLSIAHGVSLFGWLVASLEQQAIVE